jgi:glycerol-3-phosphate dehydrogenase
MMHDMSVLTPEESLQGLREFLQRRFRGIRGVLWGDQLREEQLIEYIYLGIFAMEKKP